jgi:hypothetical protein
MATTSITRLYGLGLTPGKLRGLQRISNPNGTLSMVATDQNSSMISMMRRRGPQPSTRDRRRHVMLPGRAAHCSGLLVDGYYGYSARGRVRGTGHDGIVRVESPVRKNASGPCDDRAGLGCRQDQTLRRGCRSCWPSSSRRIRFRWRNFALTRRFTTVHRTDISSCWS